MILNAFFSGLAIGLSLIIAIGSQNAFVLRQGLTGKYVWVSILFCTGSDCILIFAGTFGIGKTFKHNPLWDKWNNKTRKWANLNRVNQKILLELHRENKLVIPCGWYMTP